MSLETSVLAQGLPHPHNLEAAMHLDAALEAEVEIQSICMQDPNFREAYDAFVARRKPVFR